MRRLRIAGVAAAAVVLAGCAGQTTRSTPISIFPDMDYQHRYDPQTERPFFADGRASRTPVEGTVPRGVMKVEPAYYTGIVNGQYVGRNPLKIDADVMEIGQRRYNTYCAPCHDQTGMGRGLVGQRSMWLPTNLHEDRVRQFNDGELFHVITAGRRSMPSYRFQIIESDRWAIIAYVRALQRAHQGTLEDVPADKRAGLQ